MPRSFRHSLPDRLWAGVPPAPTFTDSSDAKKQALAGQPGSVRNSASPYRPILASVRAPVERPGVENGNLQFPLARRFSLLFLPAETLLMNQDIDTPVPAQAVVVVACLRVPPLAAVILGADPARRNFQFFQSLSYRFESFLSSGKLQG